MKKAYNKWKQVAEKIGNFQISIIFSILYFILYTPVGLVLNLFKDFLNIKTDPEWIRYEDNVSTLEKMKEQ